MEVVPHTDAEEFARLARPLLAADPVRHTSVADRARRRRRGTFAPAAMLTVHEGGERRSARCCAPRQRPALVSARAAALRRRRSPTPWTGRDPELDGAQGPADGGRGVRRRLDRAHGRAVQVAMRMRLFALDELRAARRAFPARPGSSGPDDDAGSTCSPRGGRRSTPSWTPRWPHPHTSRDEVARALAAGRGRAAVGGRRRAGRAGGRARGHGGHVADRAGLHPARPPRPRLRRRRHRRGRAVGARQWRPAIVLLYTDLANPTTNRLYPRLGFRPRYDALELRFVPPGRVT